MATGREAEVDSIQMQLGTGSIQIMTFFILGLIYSRGAWHVFGIMFLAADPGHECSLPIQLFNDSDSYLDSSYNEVVNSKPGADIAGLDSTIISESLGATPNFDMISPTLYSFQGGIPGVSRINWTSDSCGLKYSNQNGTTVMLPGECPYGWTYGSDYETTILSEWNLVCDRNFLVELSITIFMIGSTIGAMTISPLADRFGRKKVMMACLLSQLVFGCALAFVNSYILFAVLRFVIGMLNNGIGLTSYVLMTETFPTCHRTTMSIAFQVFWSLGIMTVSGLGFLVRNWRHLELLLSLPSVLLIGFFWLLPESLPWLISQKRWKEARQMIQLIAKRNKKIVSADVLIPVECESDNSSTEAVPMQRSDAIDREGDEHLSSGERDEELKIKSDCRHQDNPLICLDSQSGVGFAVKEHSCSILDLFRNSRLRRYSLIMFFLFLVNSLGYFGISFSVPVLHGDPFVNLCIMGAVEIPANIIGIVAGQRVGRRIPNAGFLLLCGIANIVALFVPPEKGLLKLGFVMLGKFGITAAYSTIYLYSAEIFPTAIRNHAMGISSVFENIGSISAPLIVHGAKSIPQLPLVLFGVLTIIGGGLSLLLPETYSKPLPQTVHDITSEK
ncbi:hypothetical protein C0Q70_21224 [Pomacea canaliculata]|uniref:Major facilitator superfamily (MFS) profile domain-containing protein n=1 Tax=Pomacea canaliculata TaxID=400727 RepID=A0A2T7NBX8_POMCA|nr:solute carrier family 22 member 13-like [Pomacea canaliculata]XP_025078596.1 solute carrier family 22 member 13-like [Pomacea canaliculata]PVD18674.1 hypothetical protein C0Q70_21224 [Pomacea canaliculata]